MKTFLAIAVLCQTISIYLEVASKRQEEPNVTVYLSQRAWNWSEILLFFSFSEVNAYEGK